MPVQVVDERGFVLEKGTIGTEKVLTFEPKPSFFYGSPFSKEVFQGASYFIRLLAPDGSQPGQTFEIRISVQSCAAPGKLLIKVDPDRSSWLSEDV